jgi:hypothetical protein
MAKYHGKIGYIIPTEVRPGVWKDMPIEKEAYGDFLQEKGNIQQTDKISKDVSISGQLVVMATQFAMTNFQHIRYATYMGTAWSVTSVRPAYPRLHLTLGEKYNVQPRNGDAEEVE